MPGPDRKQRPPVPVDQLIDMLDEFGDGYLDTEEGEAFGRLMNVLEAFAVELAPADTGNLEGSTVVRVDRQGEKLVGTLTFGAEYAATVHELPDSARGPKTAQKPGNEFGLAGPKYLERPLRGFVKQLGEDMAESLRKYWGGQGTGGKRRGRR